MTANPLAISSYDVVLYPGNPYRESHPDHLATIARLFGLDSPPAEQARVLELGCACGANLLPMAVSVPSASFVGIDLSPRQIEIARQTAEPLNLSNVEFRQGSITEIGPDDGLFDYIICHGVFSWVPQTVREHILSVCSNNLSPRGVAYISYNTYPGWFMRGMVRRMMGFHARQFVEPRDQLEQARALLDFLSASCTGGDPAYQALLTRELEILRQCNDSYLFHEHLEDVNEPQFFYEFVEQASRHKLRYLAEPNLREMVAANVDPQVERVLQKLGANIIHFEQYLDFLRNRTFRRTLLCHADQIPIREIDPDRMKRFRVTSHLKRIGNEGTLCDGSAWEFAAGSQSATVSHFAHKAALCRLQEAGLAGLWCDDLREQSNRMVNAVGTTEPTAQVAPGEIEELVLQLYIQGLLEISASPPRFVSGVSSAPCASPLVRQQAADGSVVTNLRHERVRLEPLERELARHLDGSRTEPELVELLDKTLLTGAMTISNDAGPLPPEKRTPELIGAILEHGLKSLSGQAILQS